MNIRWITVVAEGVAITVSILLAFAIDAWWDDRREADEVSAALISVLEDMQSSSFLVNKNLSSSRLRHRSIESLLEASIRNDSRLDSPVIDQKLSDLYWYQGESLIRDAGINSLIFSGMFAKIDDQELRRELARWPARIDYLQTQFSQHKQFLDNVWWPFMIRHGNQSQVSRRIVFVVGQPGEIRGTLPVAPTEIIDHSDLLKTREFANTLTQYWSINNDLINSYEHAERWVNQSIELLEQSLSLSHQPTVMHFDVDLRED